MTEVAKLNDSKTVAKPEDVEVDATPGPLMKKINALKNVQLKMVEIESKFFEELHILECKYAHLYEPLFEKRRQIVVGDYEPNEEEGKWKLDELNDEGATNGEVKENGKPKLDIDEKNLSESGKKLLSDLKAAFDPKNKNGAGDKDEKGIPNFWLETLQSFRITAEIIQEHDEPILAFLQDIRVILADKKPYGYTLEFHFAENPYFTNKVLTKTYELKTEVDEKDPFSYEGPDLEKAIGCKIDWKAGKNVTVKMTKKKLKSKNKKVPPKVITKEEKQDSFFNFFETPKGQEKKPKSPASSGAEDSKKDSDKKIVKHMGDDEDEEDEDAQEELYMIADFEIGQYLREKVIPKAILYYTGELDGLEEDYDDYEDDEDEDGEEDEDDDEEEEDDDDDDDDDEEDKKGPKGKKHAHGKANGPKGGFKTGGKPGEPTPNECKQN